MIVGEFANLEKIRFRKSLRLTAEIAKKHLRGQEVLLVKPRTFMNNSGVCVKKFLDKYKLSTDDVLIVYDDTDLAYGSLIFREKGSCAGHNGMRSIVSSIGTEQIDRLRIGIGSPTRGELSDYVLSDFSISEKKVLNASISEAVLAARDWIDRDSDFLMREYNRRK